MTLRWSFRHVALALVGAAMMGFGLIGILHAQSNRSRIVQFSTGDSSYLGIRMEDVTAGNMAAYKLNSERGVIVESVEKGSPAEVAGLQPRDVITEYAGMPVFSSMQMSRLVQETPAGRKVEIGLVRDGKKQAVAVTVGKRQGMDRIEPGFQEVPRGEFPDGGQDEGPGFHGYMFRMPPNMNEFPFGWNGRRGADPQERPRLGVAVQPLTDQMAAFLGVPGKEGVVVVSVSDGSAAAGRLKAGDVIVNADGQKVASPEDLTRIVRNGKSDAPMNLKVIRDKKEISVQVQLPGTDSKSGAGSYRL
jgi:serine protease Do